MANRIAFTGKGGVGKTTLAGTLARLIARSGRSVVAIDGDLNPNLAITLGCAGAEASALEPIPRGLTSFEDLEGGGRRLVLSKPFGDIVNEHAVPTPEGVPLILMGRPDHAGKG